MSSPHLDNLARIGQLDRVAVSKERGLRVLESARARLKDAGRAQNSNETRFDCAYNAIRAVADIGLILEGFRTATSRPGHHQTALQCLVHTVGIEEATIRLLDGLRRQRNLADYDGEMVTDSALAECIGQATSLIQRIEQRLRQEGWLP